jgi:hypothetical protein
MGAGTGRGFGSCVGNRGISGQACGQGFGQGRGFRRMAVATGLSGRMRCCYPNAPLAQDPAQEKTVLTNQVKYLESQLEQLKAHLQKFED